MSGCRFRRTTQAIFTGLGDGVTHIFVLIPETEDGTYGEAKRIVQTTNY